jgi:hypothetical protein
VPVADIRIPDYVTDENILSTMRISEKEKRDIEFKTRGQSDNIEWLRQRLLQQPTIIR